MKSRVASDPRRRRLQVLSRPWSSCVPRKIAPNSNWGRGRLHVSKGTRRYGGKGKVQAGEMEGG